MAAVRPSPNLSEIAGAGTIRLKPQPRACMRWETDGRRLNRSRSSLLGLHLCANARRKDGFLDRAAWTGGKVQPADRMPDVRAPAAWWS